MVNLVLRAHAFVPSAFRPLKSFDEGGGGNVQPMLDAQNKEFPKYRQLQPILDSDTDYFDSESEMDLGRDIHVVSTAGRWVTSFCALLLVSEL